MFHPLQLPSLQKVRAEAYISVRDTYLDLYQKEVEKLPYYNTPDFAPLFIEEAEVNLKIPHTIADFSFLNQESSPKETIFLHDFPTIQRIISIS